MLTAGHLRHRAGISQSLAHTPACSLLTRPYEEVAGTLLKHIEGEEIAVCLLAFNHDLANSQTSK